jgi:hypothetical protein
MTVENVKIEFELAGVHGEMLSELATVTLAPPSVLARRLIEAILDEDMASDERTTLPN